MPLDFSLSPEQEAVRARVREALRPLRGWAGRGGQEDFLEETLSFVRFVNIRATAMAEQDKHR